MKRLFAVILSLCMIFALTGCGASVVGTWTGRGDAVDSLSQQIDPELAAYITTVPYDVTINIDKDGTYTYIFDLSPAMPELKTAIRNYLEDYIVSSGYTVEFFESAVGMTLDEYVEDAAKDMTSTESGGGSYTFEKGVLTLDPGTSGELVCPVNGKTFTMTTDFGPVTMTRTDG